ncbi:MAG: 30S ribosomal protein S20 [Candidatus Omnitrophota bacterium]|nr:30S ribosomal protein S20 [Candidatus Omnitrophota bacterium]
MPIKRASFKDLRKSNRRHLRNISIRSELHSHSKKVEELIAAKKGDEAGAALKIFISKLGKAASKGIIHKNAASRKSSRLMKRISALSKA